MSGGGGGAAPGDDKSSMTILWAIAAIFMVCAAIWWGFSDELKAFFLWLRRVEFKLVYNILNFLPFFETEAAELKDYLDALKEFNPGNLTSVAAESFSETIGLYLRYPFVIILGVGLFFLSKKNVKSRYKKRYDMRMLLEQEQSEWPQTKVVADLNLADADLDEGTWAMAITPMAFAKKYDLLDVTAEPPAATEFLKGPRFKAIVNVQKAEQVFAEQLGKMWHDVSSMAMPRRALFAVFAARANRDTKRAQALVRQMADSAHGKELNIDFDGVDELWRKHINKLEIQKICASHAYEFTVLISMLLLAREDGVLPSADFLWIKAVDRQLWYVINNTGRQTSFCEVAGVYAHWLAEKYLSRPLSVPMIKQAVIALQKAINEIIYQPEEEERIRLLKAAGLII